LGEIDASQLCGLLQEVADQTKVEELIFQVQKKLEVPQDMCEEAINKLRAQGYFIAAGLKCTTEDGWRRLELPLAIEMELRRSVMNY
jgi:hypothetical protein